MSKVKENDNSDSLYDFVLKNYKDLDAAIKVFEMGKKLLPKKIRQKIYYDLRKERYSNGKEFNVNLQGDEIWWTPHDDNRIWRSKGSDDGLYFVLEIGDNFADYLVLPIDTCLYLGLKYKLNGSVGIGKLRKLRSYMSDHKQTIKKQHFETSDIDDDYALGWIVEYMPDHELNLAAITASERQRFPNEIIERMKTLTSTLLPIIQKYKK